MYKDKMLSYLPNYERKSKVLGEFFYAVATEFENKDSILDDLEKQLFIDTATWGLDIYEKDLGIKTDLSKSYEDRRSVIKSKERGTGKVDRALIKIVADAWANGNCDVTFDGRINIKFNSIYGTPANLQDLQNAIDEIKPAHLSVIYQFAYLLIKNIHNIMTINELQNTKLNMFAGGVV